MIPTVAVNAAGWRLDPPGSVAVAPLSGDLVKLFPGGHAFGISTSEGVELIVHIGLDTIELKGEGFENIATEGQQVKAGTPIVRFDRTTIERKGKMIVSPVVSTGEGTIVRRATGKVQAGRDILFVLKV